MADDIVLYSENICKNFDITHALINVSISFKKGEIHGLIGENGSGKSTYSSILSGIYPATSGKFFLNGKELHFDSMIDANRAGISIIVQEMGTLPGLTVAENIFLGHEDMFTKGGIKNKRLMEKSAQEYLNRYGFDHIKAGTMIDHYNFEDRKLVELVKATYNDPQIVIVDETTTALSQNGREILFKHMEQLRNAGSVVIFISHDLAEVIEHTDRISCLRDGILVGTVNSSDVTPDDLKRLMVGREIGDHYYRTDYGEAISDEVVLDVKNVTVPNEIFGINLQLHRGEILGIGGLSDCGIHAIGKAIFGAAFDREGTVTLADGTEITDIPQAIKHSIAYSSKDRDNESVVLGGTIRDNIVLPSLDDLAVNNLLSGKKLKAAANEHAKQMSVKMAGIDQYVSDLSGGNKQKVVLARWICKDSDILVLDSPTRGIDVKVKADIYALMREMTLNGKSIIMISEEIQELLGMSDRILIMKDGKINGEFLRSKTLGEEDLIAKMI